MLKLKNQADYILHLRQPGALTAGNDVDATIIPDDGYIYGILCQAGVIGVAGGANDGLIDVNVNGTTIIGATVITFSHTTAAIGPTSYGSIVGGAPVKVSKGDVLSMDVDQTFNGGTAPLNVSLAFAFRRSKTSPPAQMRLGTLVVE